MDNNIVQVKEIEGALIGAVLRDGSIYERAREVLSDEQFGVHAYGYAWQAMEGLRNAGLSIDVFTVADELERMGKLQDFSSGPMVGRMLLSHLRSEGDPRHVMSYVEDVEDYHIKRKLEPFLLQWESWRRNGRRGKIIVKDIQSELDQIKFYNQDDEYTVPFSVAVSEAYDDVDAASKGKNTGIETGLIDLDEMLGGLKKTNLYIVAARPGMGKTALMLTVAMNAAKKGKKVAIFSLEMSRSQVAQRLISQESGIDLHRLMNGKLEEREWPLFTHAVEVVASLPITINDLSSINITDVRHTARKIKEDSGLDLVIVDYIQLADVAKKSENRQLDVSEISRGLKYMARELNLPVLAASQLSRKIEERASKKPILSDLRESGSLEQDAYSVMFIHFPSEIDQKMKYTPADIIVAKHRNGPVGTVSILFHGEITQFKNATGKQFAPNS